MLKWNNERNEKLTQRVIDKVTPDTPVKKKIELAQKKLCLQINKLDDIHTRLKKQHDLMFNKIVHAQRTNNIGYAKVYAGELHEIRKTRDMLNNAKLAMEQIQLRLNTVSELGDVIVTLSPCMSVIKGLSASVGNIMPSVNTSMQDLSSILGDVLSDSAVNENVFTESKGSSQETLSILEEAHKIIEGQTSTNIPDVPIELEQRKQVQREII